MPLNLLLLPLFKFHLVSVSKSITNNYQRLGSAGAIDTNALAPMLCFALVSRNKNVKMCMISLAG